LSLLTHLRKIMLEETPATVNYSRLTHTTYISLVEDSRQNFHGSPDRLGTRTYYREYQAQLFTVQKLSRAR